MTDPLVTVTDGQRLLGHIFETRDGQFRAEGPDGEDLGTHPAREAARSAIVQNNIASRKGQANG